MKVVDNFLDKEDFSKIRDKIEGPWFPWFWNENSTEDDNIPQLIHSFIKDDQITSVFFDLLKDCKLFKKLNAYGLTKCKANLNYKTTENIVGMYHTDFDVEEDSDYYRDDIHDITTSILYINTNNGGTQFSDGTRVKSVSNRLVTFDCCTEHAPVTCTDEDRRILININYFKNKPN
tara:strand:+ start:380 stop:907 length:528 start_codon:yes stop_codon:yes gene_type:complete